MDPAGTAGHVDRRTAALNSVWLARTIELDNVRLDVRDWPGIGGTLVHLPDPLRESDLVLQVAAALAPRYRVLSIGIRPDQPYQVQVSNVHGVLAQFGFAAPVLLAEGLSCASALLLAMWYPGTVGSIVLADTCPPEGETLVARSLRDCPPAFTRLQQSLTCTVLEIASTDTKLVDALRKLLG